ncbi:MAG: hypothetical protein H7A24_01005 [Leptospiraceae bacterium]|nr:hypothetical protein [Leptospiraceae bacterium]MCP5510430.1 hypothetical protein [Leptospiraceae bacterium]
MIEWLSGYAIYLSGFLFILVGLLIFFLIKLKNENKQINEKNTVLLTSLVKMEHAILLTNKQVEKSIHQIETSTNGAIEDFSKLMDISQSISRDLEALTGQVKVSSGSQKFFSRVDKIKNLNLTQIDHFHPLINKLQFEDINRQIINHVLELLNIISSDIQNQKNSSNSLKNEDKIKDEVEKIFLSLSSMKSEREIMGQVSVESDDDVTFF